MSQFPPPPLPLGPLAYEQPQHQLRPGTMTALAIVSIVIAGFSALFSAVGMLSTVAMLVMSSIAMPMTPPPVISATTAPATAPATAAAAGPVMMSPFQFSIPTLILNVLAGVASLIAAGVLVAAGIQILRNRRSGRKLHWIFIAIKLPTVLLAFVAAYLYTSSLMQGISSMPGATPQPAYFNWMFIVQGVVMALVSLAYPVTLIFLLRTRTAREYFASLTV